MAISALTNAFAMLNKAMGMTIQLAPSVTDALAPREGSDEWFAAMRANETGGAGAVDENGRPIEPTKPGPLRSLRGAAAAVAATEAATSSILRAQDALDDHVANFVRYGQEMSEGTAKYLDALAKKVSVFGATGDVFLTKFFELMAHIEKAQDDNNVMLSSQLQEMLAALVKDIQKWLGKEGEMFDPQQFFSQAALGNGVKWDTCDKALTISVTVSFIQQCTFYMTVFGKAVL